MRTLVIDPAHGGKSLGIVGPAGTLEKDINLQLALALKEKLLGYSLKVSLTRQDDTQLPKRERVDACIAGELGLQLHCGGEGQRAPLEILVGSKGSKLAREFAKSLSGELSRSLRLPSEVVRDSKNKFELLKKAQNTMMVFTGTLHIPAGEARILDSEWIPNVSSSMFRAIVNWFQL